MSEWKARRFWKDAAIREADKGWEIALDGRSLRTPNKHPLIVPTPALAEAIAGEWDAQHDVINPQTMPLTRAANSAVEKVQPQRHEVIAMLAGYGATDLLSYRAGEPAELVNRQAAGWDPLLDWAEGRFGARLNVTVGVIPVAQEPASLDRLHGALEDLDLYGLTAAHDLVTLPGSLVLGLAVIHDRLPADEAHRLSRLDEVFQAERWGADEEAQEAAGARLDAMCVAARLYELSRPG